MSSNFIIEIPTFRAYFCSTMVPLFFRFSKEYRNVTTGELLRDLYKAYGILFVFSVQGTAGKFNVIPLFINIGSGLALLALVSHFCHISMLLCVRKIINYLQATIICDIVLLYVLKKRHFYENKKYLKLVDEDFLKVSKCV